MFISIISIVILILILIDILILILIVILILILILIVVRIVIVILSHTGVRATMSIQYLRTIKIIVFMITRCSTRLVVIRFPRVWFVKPHFLKKWSLIKVTVLSSWAVSCTKMVSIATVVTASEAERKKIQKILFLLNRCCRLVSGCCLVSILVEERRCVLLDLSGL